MRRSTLPFGSMKTDGLVSINIIEKWIFFFSLPLLFVSPSLFLLFPPSFFSSLFHFLIHPNFPSLVCSPSHFFFIFHFLFSLIFSFLSFSLLFSFIFSFLSLFFIIINRMVQKWGKLPPTFLHCHLSSSQIIFIFSLFSFTSFSST